MDYTYLLENEPNKHISISELFNENSMNILKVLCYHINNEIKYPFIQFMMEKIPFCNNIVKEQFTLPFILFSGTSKSIETLVIERTKTLLDGIYCDTTALNEDMYKGIIYDTFDCPYALINITGIDISGLKLFRNTLTWFALPSEIINQKKICNIDVDEETVELFSSIPEISILRDTQTNKPFILPDVVYTGGEKKEVEFNSIFCKPARKINSTNGKYYYFYRSFKDVVKEGGWSSTPSIRYNMSNRQIVENEYGRYISGGINRYALFIEGKLYIEDNSEISLTDETIEKYYPEPTIIVGFNSENICSPDILVKEYNSFYPLSYHDLNKRLLGDQYVRDNSLQYMIE